ncbi:hypothetical protein BHE74_00005999 [Ensete ventricosum]|nr:hypothetical protein BHE74_00005999 [Ensete ventricosum]
MVVEAETGKSILEVAHDNHIEIESACGGVCACTTCHCIIREGFNTLEEADELEEDFLDRAAALIQGNVMSLKWVDVQEIAIQLAEAHPDVNPLSVNFVTLRNLVMALPEFDDIPDRGGEKVLEAIQGLWIEEAD